MKLVDVVCFLTTKSTGAEVTGKYGKKIRGKSLRSALERVMGGHDRSSGRPGTRTAFGVRRYVLNEVSQDYLAVHTGSKARLYKERKGKERTAARLPN